jgi:hypothetical protein
MHQEDYLVVQAFDKVPMIHKLLAQTIKDKMDFIVKNSNRDLVEEEKDRFALHVNIVKTALWSLSNMAAGPPYMLDELLRE